MAFDREGTLRKAEKLLRQGKLDLAITEYRTVVEAEPLDWNSANALGDLYFRAGQTDRAIAEYMRIADHLASEGFRPKAIALYKKVLKIKPDEERAMWQLGALSARQGLLVEARAQFAAVADRRRGAGDRRGEAEARIALGDLDGADLETRLAGARARVELAQAAKAIEQLKQLGADLQEKGKPDEALKVMLEAAALAPADAEVRQSLIGVYTARGELEQARKYATTAAELKALGAEMSRRGRDADALGLLAAAAGMDASDLAVRAQLAEAYLARNERENARALLTPEVAAANPDLLWKVAEMELREGSIQEGGALLQQIIAAHPDRRDALVILGCSVGEAHPDAGYECVDVAARAAIAGDEWGTAAAALNEFVHRVPNHIPALMRLVEICVDGGLEATMHSAQAQLADAYLVAGAGAEARVIAEDLVAREPWNRANIERFRRALTLLGEPNVDALIAERLSGQSPFVSTDLLWGADAGLEDAPESAQSAEAAPAPAAEQPAAAPAIQRPQAEVDLSAVLEDLNGVPAPIAAQGPTPSIERTLESVREEALRQMPSDEVGEQHFGLATSYIESGMIDQAMQALEVAARSLAYRFRAGALLAKFHADTGNHARAIEWYERAAEAPAPTPAASHQLLYELAGALEAQGEDARALAVLLELQSEAGDYRDLATRVEQLMRR